MTSHKEVLSFAVAAHFAVLLTALLPTTVLAEDAAAASSFHANEFCAGDEFVYPANTQGQCVDQVVNGQPTGKIIGTGCQCEVSFPASSGSPDEMITVKGKCALDPRFGRGSCRAVITSTPAPGTPSGNSPSPDGQMNLGASSVAPPGSNAPAPVPVTPSAPVPVAVSDSGTAAMQSAYAPSPSVAPTAAPTVGGDYTSNLRALSAAPDYTSHSGYSGVQPAMGYYGQPLPGNQYMIPAGSFQNKVSSLNGYPYSASQPQYSGQPAYYGYQTGRTATSGVTFGSGSKQFYGPIQDYTSLLDILAGAGDSIIKGLDKMYNSLSGVSSYSSYSTTPIETPSYLGTTTNIDIAGKSETSDTPTTTTAEALVAVQDVAESIHAMEALLSSRENQAEASSTTTSVPDNVKQPISGIPKSTSSPLLFIATSTGEESADIKAALEDAKARMTKLENELENSQGQIGKSNEKIQQLTDELRALNQRIKAANEALADPQISEEQRKGLVAAIMENIKLSLADLEKQLAEATAVQEPRTIGEILVESLSNVVTKIASLIAQIVRMITGIF